jgi:hypothetical protein
MRTSNNSNNNVKVIIINGSAVVFLLAGLAYYFLVYDKKPPEPICSRQSWQFCSISSLRKYAVETLTPLPPDRLISVPIGSSFPISYNQTNKELYISGTSTPPKHSSMEIVGYVDKNNQKVYFTASSILDLVDSAITPSRTIMAGNQKVPVINVVVRNGSQEFVKQQIDAISLERDIINAAVSEYWKNRK